MHARRRYRRRPSWRLALCGGLLLLIAARFAEQQHSQGGAAESTLLRGGEAEVTDVDPDGTLRVRQLDERGRSHVLPVRLLGVAFAPQTESAAAARLRQVSAAQAVRIELDQRRIDSSRRFLAYVHHGDVLLNELVIREGWATVENYPGDSFPIHRRLRAAEQDACDNRRGLWREFVPFAPQVLPFGSRLP